MMDFSRRSARGVLAVCVLVSVVWGLAGCAGKMPDMSERTSLKPLHDTDADLPIEEERYWIGLVYADEMLHKQGEDDELCWAACALTARAMAGEGNLPSQQILRAQSMVLLPGDQRERANAIEVMNALVPDYRQRMGNRYLFDAMDVFPVSDQELVYSLWVGSPAVVGLHGQTDGGEDLYWRYDGHAYVLVGMEYIPTSDSRVAWRKALRDSSSIWDWFWESVQRLDFKDVPPAFRMPSVKGVRVFLYDPHPLAPEPDSIVELSWDEFTKRVMFAYSAELIDQNIKGDVVWLDRNNRGPGVHFRAGTVSASLNFVE